MAIWMSRKSRKKKRVQMSRRCRTSQCERLALRRWRQTFVLLFCAAGGMCAGTGCGFLGPDGLWTKHTEANRREAARQRWDEVRGGVKLQVAEHHLEAGRLDEAETVLRQVMAMSPRQEKAYTLAARLYLEQGRLAEARAATSTALSMRGDDAAIHYLAGMVEERYENPESAAEHYQKAEALAPNVVEYVMASAETYAALGEPLRGLEIVERRIRDFDGSVALRLLAAELSRALERREAATTHCRAAVQLCGGDEKIAIEAALILNWAGAHTEAIAVLEPIVRSAQSKGTTPSARGDEVRDGLSPVVIRELASAYARVDRWADAAALLRPMLRSNESDAFAWCLYARSVLAMGNLGEAHRVITEFNCRRPPRAEALLLEAYICRELGLEDAAGRAAARALEIDAGLAEATWIVSRSDNVDAPTTARQGSEPAGMMTLGTEPSLPDAVGRKSKTAREPDVGEALETTFRVEACACPTCVGNREIEPRRDSSNEVVRLSDSEDRKRMEP